MYLIEFQKGEFINGERIDWVCVGNKSVQFTISGDAGSLFKVDEELQSVFVNNLQALNGNVSNIQTSYTESGKDI